MSVYLLVIGCVFVKQVPDAIKAHADTAPGSFHSLPGPRPRRLYSWPYGILIGHLRGASTLCCSRQLSTSEAFQAGRPRNEDGGAEGKVVRGEGTG
jgi:hypothetical protein